MLAATDLSGCSRAALIKAAELFPDAAIDLIHAYHVPYESWLNSDEVRAEVRDEAQQALSAFLNNTALSDSLRERIAAKIDYGETATVMAKALQDSAADLVVLGTHGHSGFVHATIGSTAESLLSWVGPDTLMVRQRD
jgi:nucleotide-binding universal stress UspA family protein